MIYLNHNKGLFKIICKNVIHLIRLRFEANNKLQPKLVDKIKHVQHRHLQSWIRPCFYSFLDIPHVALRIHVE